MKTTGEDDHGDELSVPSLSDPVPTTVTSITGPAIVPSSAASYKTRIDAMIDRASMHDPQEQIHVWSPKKIVFSYYNSEDKRVLCVLFCLSSGSLCGDGSGVDIKVTNDGWELVLSEKWDDYFTNAELYYHKFPRAHN